MEIIRVKDPSIGVGISLQISASALTLNLSTNIWAVIAKCFVQSIITYVIGPIYEIILEVERIHEEIVINGFNSTAKIKITAIRQIENLYEREKEKVNGSNSLTEARKQRLINSLDRALEFDIDKIIYYE